MTTFKIEEKHYNIIKEIADNNDVDLIEIIDCFFDYIYDNDIYKTFGKAFWDCKEEIEVKTTYNHIKKWSEEYESEPSTIFEYMMEEIERFKTEYEFI